MDGRGSCDQWSDYDDTSAVGPWVIIKHSADSVDQLRQAFSAVWCGMRVVQPGVQCASFLERNVDQRSPGP
jgi:hypothetical protein